MSQSSRSIVVVDVEWFRHKDKKPIVKEIAVYGDVLDSLILQPPRDIYTFSEGQRRSFRWLTRNLHGLLWQEVDYPYSFLTSFVQSVLLRYSDRSFYAKGLEKCNHLSLLFGRHFSDLDETACPKVTGNHFICKSGQEQHTRGIHCARNKAAEFMHYLEQQINVQRLRAGSRYFRKLDITHKRNCNIAHQEGDSPSQQRANPEKD